MKQQQLLAVKIFQLNQTLAIDRRQLKIQMGFANLWSILMGLCRQCPRQKKQDRADHDPRIDESHFNVYNVGDRKSSCYPFFKC